ncbi:MAG: WYL domain-containing protein [Anaerolineae bacterium]|jgi:predicted DNA-binding transcriptional regulator YafY
MPNEKNDKKQPVYTWLPKVILTFLVFGTLFFVVYQVTGGMTADLGDKSMWALLVAMALLVLLPVVDRIQSISLSPTGFEAKLSETQAKAIKEVGAMVEDPKAAEVAQAQILQAQSADQVQAAVAEAVKLNVTRTVDTVREAIQKKRKCYVRYRPVPDEPVQSYYAAPLDIKPGKSAATKANDYLWAYSYEHESVVSLRLDRVIGVEMSEEVFDPAEVTTPGKEPEWNVAREW